MPTDCLTSISRHHTSFGVYELYQLSSVDVETTRERVTNATSSSFSKERDDNRLDIFSDSICRRIMAASKGNVVAHPPPPSNLLSNQLERRAPVVGESSRALHRLFARPCAHTLPCVHFTRFIIVNQQKKIVQFSLKKNKSKQNAIHRFVSSSNCPARTPS